MHEPILKQLGLTEDQIAVYEALLKTGQIKASKLTQKTPYKRVLVYKLLQD
jgi:sugar-specific transcriptional regulator TrmB